MPAELRASSKFQILGKLGQGGIGAVFKAKHNFLGELVAIKVMNADVVGHPEARSRFLREMQAAGQLKHKNIVRALDAEQIGDLLVLVMEYVGGITLDRLVAQRGPLPVDLSCLYILQVALGLQHAHEKDMVHRDIKPANVIVTPKGEVKLLDFGLARTARADGQEEPDTDADVHGHAGICCTRTSDGRPQRRHSADIYSLGCTLYYLLSGKPPFESDTPMETIVAQIQDEAQPLTEVRPEVPPGLWAVVAKMLEKSPGPAVSDADRGGAGTAAFRGVQRAARGSPREQVRAAALAGDGCRQQIGAAAVADGRHANRDFRRSRGSAFVRAGSAVEDAGASASAGDESEEEVAGVAGVPCRDRGEPGHDGAVGLGTLHDRGEGNGGHPHRGRKSVPGDRPGGCGGVC